MGNRNTHSAAKGGKANPFNMLVSKGDLLVAILRGFLGRLPIGTDGQVLTVDLAQTLGLKWAAVGGSIVDITEFTDSSLRSTASSAFVDSGWSFNFTPLYSTSDVLVIITVAVVPNANRIDCSINVDAGADQFLSIIQGSGIIISTTFSRLFSALSVSAHTFRLRIRNEDGTTTVDVRGDVVTSRARVVEIKT